LRIAFKHIIILFIGFQLISIQNVSGQSGFRNEREMMVIATDYFENDLFNMAFPLYSQLLSLDPKNPELSYRFGVCLMYSDRTNTEEPIIYLENAINKVADIDLYYHLATAYHHNYFFTDAIYNYRKYLQLAKNKVRKDYDVYRKITMCQNGIEMLRAVDDLYVIEKSEVDKKAFYRSYNLMDYGGRILNLPKEFLNRSDLKNQEDKIAYFNPKAKMLFYAINNKNQKDIYYRIQENDREWSAPIALSSTINTEYDEDYPIFMPDGKTLYFSSKGHNTIGGFDIFQSVFDSLSGQWSKPVNLSFPFNTPSDDILFISNPDETIAWFASDRNSISNKISVYKVGIIKKENQNADLSNIYNKDNLSSDDLGRIKNMALLDINISDKAFNEIPVERKRKLDVLLKNEATRITQNIRQANLINVDREIAVQELQTDLVDSIKNVILQVDSNLESIKSLYLQTQYLVTSKASNVQQGYSELSLHLQKAQNATSIDQKKAFLKNANKTLFKTLRLDHQYGILNNIEHQIDNQIAAQRELLFQATAMFGDIQRFIVKQNDREARKNIKLLDELIQQADTLTDYTRIIDYARGELFNINYPSNLLNESTFATYFLEDNSENAPILALESRFANYIPEISKLVAPSDIVENNSTKSRQEIALVSSQVSVVNNEPKDSQSTKTGLTANTPSMQIREELSAISRRQTERLDWLKQQSALLTKKASEKLDDSNRSLLDFEQTREKYNKGIINDQNLVIAKQTESQNLLYQSLAIISLAEKTDSLYQIERKRNDEHINQIFAIEQALQSNQIEKAHSLLIALEVTLNNPIFSQENLVLNWIKESINSIPSQKKLANEALEISQKFTDASMQLMMEAEDLKENAKSKSNAFKRRQISIEAEKKEALALQIKSNSDKQLALGNKLYDEIKKAEAIQQIIDEFSSPVFLAQETPQIINPEKRKLELTERLETREQASSLSLESSNEISKPNLANIPKMNALLAYSTKRVIGQLLAEELDVNKREIVHLLDLGKMLKGAATRENNLKITNLRKEADSLQNASTLAFMEAGNIYNQLHPDDKILADESSNDFENYLNNIRNRIAQLLDDVTLLSEQVGKAKDNASRENLKRQADEKEQVAMYLILEEFEIIAQRNQQKYRKNALIIDKLSFANQSKKEQELMRAISDQIENYIQLANNKRIKAEAEELSFTLTKALLQDAFSYESSALDLQLEAIRMMRENDIESMLAYQINNQRDTKPETASNTVIPPKEVETPLAKNSDENSKPTLNLNPTIKETDKTILADANDEIQEKQITNPIIEEKTIIESANTLDVSKNATNSPNIFPDVSISKEPIDIQFSVQIAAIRALKTTDSFLNVMELFTLKDSEKELYRYFSGKFTELKAAIIRRNSLRQQGYADAFIKSWKNGKVVNVYEAAGNIDKTTLALLNESIISLPSKYRNINFSATNISQLTGVYYSVQVGAYSRPRSSANLFGISPLYHNRLKSGLWVYFNGIFKSISDAEKNKTSIRSKGVPDAFIVAFNEGEKVSLVNARKAIRQGVTYPANEDIIMLDDAAVAVDSQLKTIIGDEKTVLRIYTYKVQIGVYSQPVSFNWVTEKLGKTSNNKVEYFISNTGKYIYTIGNFRSYAEASIFNTEQVKKIIKDAFVVTFDNGKKK
jgi:hypothetical protein